MATARIVLRIVSSTQSVKDIPLDRLVRLPAEPGATYKVIDAATQKPLGGIVLKKKGDALLVEIDSEPAAQVEHFYADNQTGAFDVGSGGGAGESHLITQSTPTAEGGDVVWQAGSDQAGVAVAGESSEFVLGGALLGGVGLAAGGGGGAAAPAVVNNIVAGTIVGGPVVATNDLKVVAYQADGVTVLGEGVVDASGRFSISVGSYTGVVIAKVVNQGTGADYLDEATNAGKDLNVQLFSSGVVTAPNTTLTLNINVLTTVAYHKAVAVVGGNPLDVATVDNTNTAIAQTFGVQDLHATQIVTVNGTTTYNAADGLSAGETYGAVLAAFSGADQANAGNSQATVDNIVAGMTVTGATATLNAAAQTEIITGGQTANVNAGGAITAILDTIAPNAPTLGTVLSNSATPTLRGTAEAGATVTVTVGGATYSVVADVNGNWSVNTATAAPASGTFTPLTGATNPVSVTATDTAGNVSTAGSGNLVVDTVAPNVPTLGTVLSNSATPTLSGTAEAGATVTVTVGGATYSVVADANGNWSVNTATAAPASGTFTPLTGATNPAIVMAIDSAGNVSTAGVGNFVVDTVAPNAPTLALGGDTGSSTTDGLTSNGTVNIAGLEIGAGAAWEYSLDGGANWTAGSGTSVTLTGDGAKSLTVRQTDAAGNVSASSTALAFTLDTTVAAPTLALAGDTGSSTTDGLTSNGTVNVAGIEAGATWEYSLDGGTTWTAGTGTSVTLNGDGAKSLTVRQTDAAGNSGTALTQAYTLDTTAPTTTVSTKAFSADTGTSSTDFITATAAQTISGTLSAVTVTGEIVQVSLDNGSTWTTATNTIGQNAWSLAGQTLSGSSTLQVRVTDAAGNSGTALTQAYTLDTTAPTASATTETIASTASTTVQSSETGTAYLVSTAITANALTDITNAADTAWNSVAITAANTNTSLAATGLAAGTYKLYTSDAAGNLSVPSANTATVASGADTSIVVFDLIEGVSSSHSSRTFDATLTYDIYIRVSSVSNTLSTDGISAATPNGGGWGQWGGVSNLGADDRITLVGNGTPLIGSGGGSAVSGSVIRAAVTNQIWRTAGGMYAARFHWNGSLTRNAAGISFAHLFVPNTRLPASIGASYNTNGGAIGYGISIATNILTTQGLA